MRKQREENLKTKLTNYQIGVVAGIVDKNQPFWLNRRTSKRNSRSYVISIDGENFTVILRQVRGTLYEKLEERRARSFEVAEILSKEIMQRFPNSLFKGVRDGDRGEPTEHAK